MSNLFSRIFGIFYNSSAGRIDADVRRGTLPNVAGRVNFLSSDPCGYVGSQAVQRDLERGSRCLTRPEEYRE